MGGGTWVDVSGFKVWAVGCIAQGVGSSDIFHELRFYGLGFGGSGSGSGILGLGFLVSGFGFRVLKLWCRSLGFEEHQWPPSPPKIFAEFNRIRELLGGG